MSTVPLPGRQRVVLGTLTGAGSVLLVVAQATGLVGASAASAVVGLFADVLLLAAQTALLRQRLRAGYVRGALDMISGVLTAVALLSATTLGPLQQHGETPGGLEADFIVVQASVSLLMFAYACSTVGFTRDVVDARVWLFAAGTGVLAVADGAALGAPLAGVQVPGLVPGVRCVAAFVMFVAASRRPPQQLRAADEDGRSALLAPAVTLVSCCGVLGWDHLARRPTVAVVAALVATVVTTLKIALEFRQITSLSVTRRQALTDDLTGLGNRRALVTRLAAFELGEAVALTLVDLDGFKGVNDTLGHDAGDALLQQVAGRLTADGLPGELVVRQGGDEFALVAPGEALGAALGRARRLAVSLAQPFVLDGRQVQVAASVGVALSPDGVLGVEELQRRADTSMYRAKAAGGGVHVYDEHTDAGRRHETALLAELRQALVHGELVVHYQPQVCVPTGALAGVEALVRWQHPERGLLGPGEFLDLAERYGLMHDLTRQVLRAAVAQVAALRRPGLRLSVNVSARSLHRLELVQEALALLDEYRMAPAALTLEITETHLMSDADASRRTIDALAKAGVGVSIDDYGTGYSSLAYLKDLPVDELKLDRSFVSRMTEDARAAVIVRATVDLAHSLGLTLVAEGVEDETTFEQLRGLGADTAQGYHFARPLPADGLGGWLTAHDERRLLPAP